MNEVIFSGKRPEMTLFFLGLKDDETVYDLTVHKETKKRSLDSNSYFWLLVNKIAEHQKLSDSEVHDQFLSENISYYYTEDGAFDWKTSPREPNRFGLMKEKVADEYNYWLFAGYKVKLQKSDGSFCKDAKGNDITSNVYWHIKGSHQMNSGEMSRLISSVVYEAKNLGIQTATPAELEEMQRLWEQRYGKKQEN
ncbi:MAG: hypothetical protein J6Y78_08550 [Paludibacteraceae bacterium]|nr:hypothetical protein [Paludibacteraceae bacterium]